MLDTCKLIHLQKKILPQFDGLDKKLLNIKDVMIKDLQVENQRLCSKINNLEEKVVSLKENRNLLEQYSWQNNLEIMGVLDNIEDKKLKQKVIEILQKIEVNVSAQDIEACHQVGKSKNDSKKTTVCFINWKYAKNTLPDRRGLKNIDSSLIGLTNLNNIFIK